FAGDNYRNSAGAFRRQRRFWPVARCAQYHLGRKSQARRRYRCIYSGAFSILRHGGRCLLFAAGLPRLRKRAQRLQPVRPGNVSGRNRHRTRGLFIFDLAGVMLLFGLIFKFLPDVKIQWRDVWIGAVMTAIFFAIGKWALGLYLGSGAAASAYGAASSLI